MSEEAQDVTVEPEISPVVEVVKDETPVDEGTTEETQEVEAPQETPEERADRLEAAVKTAQRKIDRQKAAYTAIQKSSQEKDAKLQELLKVQQSQPQTSEAPQVPNVDDFTSYEDYEKAKDEYVDKLADYRAEQKLSQQQLEFAKREQEAARALAVQERNQSYEAEKTAFIGVVPDFQEAEEEFNNHIQLTMSTVNPMVQDAVVTQAYREGNVPALINYFGENGGQRLDELDALSKLTPIEAAVEIYKIQQKLKSTPAQKKKGEPLPKPPQTVKASGSKSKDLSKGDVLKNLGLK